MDREPFGQPVQESFFGTPLATSSDWHWVLAGKRDVIGIGCAGRKNSQNLPSSREFFQGPWYSWKAGWIGVSGMIAPRSQRQADFHLDFPSALTSQG